MYPKLLKQSLRVLLVALLSAHAFANDETVHRTGYVLQVEQRGLGSDVVVFESGFGQGTEVWKNVVADLGERFRTIVYARAGLGKSSSDGKPKLIADHVDDLHAVIQQYAPEAKVILVGHSYGGLLATQFLKKYTDRVRGLVLVDPTTLGQRRVFKLADAGRVEADDKKLLAMLPSKLAQDYRGLMSQLDQVDEGNPNDDYDVPVVLLTSTKLSKDAFVFEETALGKSLWKRQHAALFSQFSKGTHLYTQFGHNVHRESPKLVSDAVRMIINFD